MSLNSPDRVPLFKEGLREGVIEEWRQQGLPANADLTAMYHYDRREEIELDLETDLELVALSNRTDGLQILGDTLVSSESQRLPKDWEARVEDWKKRDHVLMFMVHHGLFLSLGVGEWSSFAKGIYLLMDKPEFVRDMLLILGEFAAQLVEKVLERVEVDAVIFSEPIGGNHGSLISSEMYRDFMLPSFQPILDVLSRFRVETIILRTYANTRSLLPVILGSQFNCLWAVESNPDAMDYLDIRREFGPQLHLIGGIDLDVLRRDRADIRAEMERVIPPLLADGGYIPLVDGRVREGILLKNYTFYRHMLSKMIGGRHGIMAA